MCPKIFFTLVSHLTFSSFDRRQQVGITHPGAASHQVAKIFRQVHAFRRNIWRILYIAFSDGVTKNMYWEKKSWDKIDSFWGLDPWGLRKYKGRMALPNRMNFRMNSKRPSTSAPHLQKIMLQIFYNGYGWIYARSYEGMHMISRDRGHSEGWGVGDPDNCRLESFRKLIRFGSVTLP